MTKQKKKFLKAKIAAALCDELGHAPTHEEIEKWIRFARVLYKAVATHYDSRSERVFTSSLRCRTSSMVLRISASLRATPMVEAIERNLASSSR